MTAAGRIIERLINSESVHALVLVCEAADKYLPMIDSISVPLANGQRVKVTQLDPDVARKVDETKRTLKREDRIIWALRFYKKALLAQLLWMTENEAPIFQKRFGAPPAPDQGDLQRQLQKLNDVDISPFAEYDSHGMDSPYSGFSTINAINERLGHYLSVAAQYGENSPNNIIHRLQFQRQPYGEIVSQFRRGELELMRGQAKYIETKPTPEGPYDLTDPEGPLETILEFPNGWRWFDLHRNCSVMRDDRTAPSNTAMTGHCANVAAKGEVTLLELVEPLNSERTKWKHHALFVLHKDGQLGEMKGRKNQKPSPRLWPYIRDLFLTQKQIQGTSHSLAGHAPTSNFQLSELPKHYADPIKRERPDLRKYFSKVPDPNEQI
jgi:hypothetical protein